MKITEKELDENLSKKIKRLDKIVDSFSNGTSEDSFITYDGSEFIQKKAASALKAILDEETIKELENNLFNRTSDLYTSSIISDLNDVNQEIVERSRINAKRMKEKPIYFSELNIIFSKKINDKFVILLENGEIKEVFSSVKDIANIITLITLNFAINDITPYDIVDIEEAPDGYLFATKNNGVFYLNSETLLIELKFKALDLFHLKKLTENLYITVSNEEISFFDFETSERIEKITKLKSDFQIPDLIISSEDYLFIIGKNISLSKTDNLIHGWKKDEANLSFNNFDKKILDNYPFGELIDGVIYDNNLYILEKKNNKFSILKYSIENMMKPPEIIELIQTVNDNPKGFFIVNDVFIIYSNDRMIAFDEKKNVKFNLIGRDLKKILNAGSEIFIIRNKEISVIDFPFIDDSKKDLIFNITNEACNNILILIRGISLEDKISFYDTDSNIEIKPNFLIAYKEDTIAKLTNSNSSKIKMKISIKNNNSIINGIVIKKNKVFLSR